MVGRCKDVAAAIGPPVFKKVKKRMGCEENLEGTYNHTLICSGVKGDTA